MPLLVRPAGPEDAAALRHFRCYEDGWYARDVQRLIRSKLAGFVEAGSTLRVLLFSLDGELVAVSGADADETPSTLHVVAIHNDHQGSSLGGTPLVKIVLDTVIDDLADMQPGGSVKALAARSNVRSMRMLRLAGFAVSRRFDRDYDELVLRLPVGEARNHR